MYTNLGTPFYSRGALCLQECRAPTIPCNHRNPAGKIEARCWR